MTNSHAPSRSLVARERLEVEIKSDPHECVSAILGAFTEADDPLSIFLFGDHLARVSIDEERRATISRHNPDMLRADLHERVRPLKRTRNGADWCDIPMPIVREILYTKPERLSHYFKGLKGLVTSPVLRSDGTLLSKPGFDHSSGYYYHQSSELRLPDIPEDPSQEDAQNAAKAILDLLGDFPFDNESSKANYLAGLLTPIIRTYTRGCVPLFVIDAHAAGSGKSLLVRLISTILVGGEPRFMELARDSEELAKRIVAALSTGASIVNIDNIDIPLKHGTLAAFLTSEEYEARLLGRNDRTIRVRNNATFFANGNNISIGGDMGRRVVMVRLDPRCARPWERDGFKHSDLIGHATEHRGELLAALFVMVRAWICAGEPEPAESKSFGSFEEWNRIVSGVLDYAGVTGFLANRDEVLSTIDESTEEWSIFLSALHERYGTASFTAREIRDEFSFLANLRDTLPAWLEAKAESPGFTRSIGREFAKQAGVVTLDGLRLERAPTDKHHKVARWVVRVLNVENVRTGGAS